MSKNYEVGYKQPPKKHQFRKGVSGNPRGRPKGTKNLRTDFAEELATLITVNVQGKRQTITKQRALIMALTNEAIKSDPRAMAIAIKLALQLFDVEPQPADTQQVSQL